MEYPGRSLPSWEIQLLLHWQKDPGDQQGKAVNLSCPPPHSVTCLLLQPANLKRPQGRGFNLKQRVDPPLLIRFSGLVPGQERRQALPPGHTSPPPCTCSESFAVLYHLRSEDLRIPYGHSLSPVQSPGEVSKYNFPDGEIRAARG